MSRWIALAALVIGAVAGAGLAVAATLHYPGQRTLFLFFVISYSVMALLTLPKPRLYGYTFLAAFLFLGFCAKAVALLAIGIALVEPTGGFNGGGKAWDAALSPAIAGCLAMVAIRVIHLAVFRRVRQATPLQAPPPWFYVQWGVPILAGSLALIVVLNAINLFTAFYQIGVSPRIILPAHLNAPIAWLFVSGLAIWAATLFGWEAQLPARRVGSALVIPFIEAVSSISTLGRSAYLFRALPYLLVAAEFPAFLRGALTRRRRALALGLLVVGFIASVAAVSLLRIAIYPLATPSPLSGTTSPSPVANAPSSGDGIIPSPVAGASSSSAGPPAIAAGPLRSAFDAKFKYVGREISLLIVGRWIGIEGTMAVSSYPAAGVDLFRRGLTENPAAGESAIYQRVSGSSYQTSSSFVFLTTPGAIGVLDYSGSLAVVFVGMSILTALLVSFELLASRLLGNAFTVSILAITLANAIAQMDFPYLFLVLVLEQTAALAALSLLVGRIRSSPETARMSAATLPIKQR